MQRLWSHIPTATVVSNTSNMPQKDVGSYIALHIRSAMPSASTWTSKVSTITAFIYTKHEGCAYMCIHIHIYMCAYIEMCMYISVYAVGAYVLYTYVGHCVWHFGGPGTVCWVCMLRDLKTTTIQSQKGTTWESPDSSSHLEAHGI